MSGSVLDHPASEFCPNFKTYWTKRSRGCHGELGRETPSLSLVFWECLGLTGGSERRRPLEGVGWETLLKAVRRGGVRGKATAAAPGQSRGAAFWGGAWGAARAPRDGTGWGGTVGSPPHQAPGSSEPLHLLPFVCFHSATSQPSDRSRKPATNVGREDAGRPGQPGGEIAPADCRVFRVQAREREAEGL